MKHKTLATSAVFTALAPLSHAQVFVYDIPDQSIGLGSGTLLFDLDTGNYAINSLSGSDGSIVFTSVYGDNPEKPYFSTSNNWTAMSSDGYISRLAFGDDIDGATGSMGAYLENNGSGNWANDGAGVAYVGMTNATTSQEAWLEIDYNDANNLLTLTRFAVGAAGQELTAGQTTAVPEPSKTAVLMALLAGSAALHRRRRIA